MSTAPSPGRRHVAWPVGAIVALVAVATAAVLLLVHDDGTDLGLSRSALVPTPPQTSAVPEEVRGSVFLCNSPSSPSPRCDHVATDAEKAAVSDRLTRLPGVRVVHFVSRQEAYRRFRIAFGDQPDILDSVGPEDLPESYEFVASASQYAGIAEQMKGLAGVDQVVRTPDPHADPTPPAPTPT